MKIYYQFSISSRDSIVQLANYLEQRFAKLNGDAELNHFCTFGLDTQFQFIPVNMSDIANSIKAASRLFPQLDFDVVTAKIEVEPYRTRCTNGYCSKIRNGNFYKNYNLEFEKPQEMEIIKRYMRYGSAIHEYTIRMEQSPFAWFWS